MEGAVGLVSRPQEASGRATGPLRSFASRTLARPVRTVAIASLVVTVAQVAWILTHRHVGAYDPDESGYLTTALRYGGAMGDLDPRRLVRLVLETISGPMVPLLSAPLLAVFGPNVTVGLIVQPLLAAVAAIAGAAIARQLAGPGAALVCGIWLLTTPATVRASQTYWYGLGAAAFLMVAMWALLSSDRLRNRRTWYLGLAVGAMLLTRTMTISYLPGIALAGALVAGRERRSWLGLVHAGVVATVVAAPWWIAQRVQIFDYLGRYGYGSGASHYGEGDATLAARTWNRFTGITNDVGLPSLVSAGVVGALLAGAWFVTSSDRRRRIRERWRDLAPLVVVVGCGFAALVSSVNAGVWFELPLAMAATPLVVAVLAQTARPIRLAFAGAVLAHGVVLLAIALWIVPVGDEFGTSAYYMPGFNICDARFSNASRSEWDDAAKDWRRLNETIVDMVSADQMRTGAAYSLTGSTILFNTNTLDLAAERSSRFVSFTVPDTLRPAHDRVADLSPTFEHGDGSRVERVIVVAHHDCVPFELDANTLSFERQAEQAGWSTVRVIRMPAGGRVKVMRHG